MSEYCTCRDEFISGHLPLRPVADVWVHGSCLKPSYAWWRAHFKKCENCDNWFSSPESDICFVCYPKERAGSSWQGLANQYRQHVAERDAGWQKRLAS